MIWYHKSPLKLFKIDVAIEKSNINDNIKNFPKCQMTQTQTHDKPFSIVKTEVSILLQ